MKDKYKFSISKGNFKKLHRRTRFELGQQLILLRQNRNLQINEMGSCVHFPCFLIESMELGRGDISMRHLLHLCRFYGKRPIIRLEDPKPEDFEPIPLTPEYLTYMEKSKKLFEKDYQPEEDDDDYDEDDFEDYLEEDEEEDEDGAFS